MAELNGCLSPGENVTQQISNRPRVKLCQSCGNDLTEDFAVNLTTDALLNDDNVIVICPKCGATNNFKANF